MHDLTLILIHFRIIEIVLLIRYQTRGSSACVGIAQIVHQNVLAGNTEYLT